MVDFAISCFILVTSLALALSILCRKAAPLRPRLVIAGIMLVFTAISVCSGYYCLKRFPLMAPEKTTQGPPGPCCFLPPYLQVQRMVSAL